MNREWRLQHRPLSTVKDSDLSFTTEAKPVRVPGSILMKNLYLSIDPTHRIWMSDKAQYMAPVALGEVMRAASLAVVEESDDEAYPVGAHFVCIGGVCDYFIGYPGQNILHPAGTSGLPLTTDLSVLSVIIGLTAWHGLNKILCPLTSESIVVVLGAAGAVGSLVGQMAKVKGAKVIGIAGGASKCAWLKELGFDLAIDYKTEDVQKTIAAFGGVTHYFDNVGGAISDSVLSCMSLNSKYALCGSISEYDDAWAGQKNFNMILMRRISVQGFICTDHIAELPDARAEIEALVKGGKLQFKEDIREGLETYPSCVRLLMSGDNTGKLILKL